MIFLFILIKYQKAVGSSCDMILQPAYAILVGFLAGSLSAIGFLFIGPFLKEKINLSDTCGVHSLHGMPSVFGTIVSAIAANGMNAAVMV